MLHQDDQCPRKIPTVIPPVVSSVVSDVVPPVYGPSTFPSSTIPTMETVGLSSNSGTSVLQASEPLVSTSTMADFGTGSWPDAATGAE